MTRNMMVSLIEHERITTTVPKAKHLRPKIEKLITRNQFEVAADIAKSGGYERQKVSEIYRRFGDHQYEKGEFHDPDQ